MTQSGRGRLILFGTVGLIGLVPNLLPLFIRSRRILTGQRCGRDNHRDASRRLLELCSARPVRLPAESFWIVFRRGGQFLTLNDLDLLLRIPMLAPWSNLRNSHRSGRTASARRPRSGVAGRVEPAHRTSAAQPSGPGRGLAG